MSRPNGVSDTGISLKLARPSGIPMIVTHISTPVIRCPSASHQPASTNQITLPINDPVPASARRTSVRPNGHRQNRAIRAEANPKGIVMIKMNITSATTAYPSANSRPPNTSQIRLSTSRTGRP